MDHRDLLASLTSRQRQRLTSKSDIHGLTGLGLHWGAIALSGWLILKGVPFWPVLMLIQGVLIVFLFTLLHESIHRTAFATVFVNDVVARICSFLIVLPSDWFRYFHFAHHRHTQDPEKDPELASVKPETIWQYVIYISGIPVWMDHLKTVGRNAFILCEDEFVPQKAQRKICLEARLMLAGYGLTAFIAVSFGWVEILYVWIIPVFLGQPFLRIYLLAEHGNCPFVTNMLQNSRTTFTNTLVRKVAWNMPYHAEHHAIPTVPFHKLPELHRLTREYLHITNHGYVAFNHDYISKMRR